MKSGRIISLVTVLTIAVISIAGCKSNSSTSSQVSPITQAPLATQDAAATISSAVGGDNGGVNAQMTDASIILNGSLVKISSISQALSMMTDTSTFYKNKSYNSADTSWTIYIVRTRNMTSTGIERSWTRKYQFWFVKNGKKQKNVLLPSPADSIFLNIISDSCSGEFHSTHFYHKLLSLSGGFVGKIDWANQKVTVNSTQPYIRSACDTLTYTNAERISQNTLTLTFVNVVVPFNSKPLRGLYVRAESGTINGTFTANITFVRGTSYGESPVNRTFTINFSNSSTAEMIIKNQRDGKEYSGSCNMETGGMQ